MSEMKSVDSSDGVVTGGDDVDGVGDGALSNFNRGGETGSSLTCTRVAGEVTGREDKGPRERVFEPLTVTVVVAARAVFALAVCCFALFNTL